MPMGQPPTSEELDRIRGFDHELRLTLLTELATVVSSKQSTDAVSAYLQAVEPASYPFYGKLQLKSGASVAQTLDSSGALVTEGLLEVLQAAVGDRIRIRRSEFVIRDVISSEPGLVAAFSKMIPHVILSQDGLNRTGLVRFGGTASYRVLLRAPSDAAGLALCTRLEAEFPGAEVSHYTSVVRPISAALEWAIPAMNTLSLLCLAFGSMGIAIVTYLHLLQRFETIAILKSLGATSAQVSKHLLSPGCDVCHHRERAGHRRGLVGGVDRLGDGCKVSRIRNYPPNSRARDRGKRCAGPACSGRRGVASLIATAENPALRSTAERRGREEPWLQFTSSRAPPWTHPWRSRAMRRYACPSCCGKLLRTCIASGANPASWRSPWQVAQLLA